MLSIMIGRFPGCSLLTLALVVGASTTARADMCAIDMGSNTFRRIAGSFENGRYVQRAIEKPTLGVGDDVAAHGRISDGNLAEIEQALASFKAACAKEGVSTIASALELTDRELGIGVIIEAGVGRR
jgi:hypothetical protein